MHRIKGLGFQVLGDCDFAAPVSVQSMEFESTL